MKPTHLCVALLVVAAAATAAGLLLVAAAPVVAAEPPADEKAQELGQEEAVQRSVFLAVSEMQRMYESMRLTENLGTRHRISERMRKVIDSRILPLVSAVEEHWGEKPVACEPSESVEKVGCVRRDVALALVYRGLARAIEGFHLDAPRYLACAERYYPDIQSVAIFLRRPPEFEEYAQSALMQVPEDQVAIKELMEPMIRVFEERTSVADAAKRRERAKWPLQAHEIPFRVLPKIDKLPREAKRFTGPQVSLEHLSIEPVEVDSPQSLYYANVARDDLTRLFKQLYLIQSKEEAICPDPRVIYLPEGRYRLYSSKYRDFPQSFTVTHDSQPFVLEYFFAATRGDEPPSVRIAWYPEPGLCEGRACSESEETAE